MAAERNSAPVVPEKGAKIDQARVQACLNAALLPFSIRSGVIAPLRPNASVGQQSAMHTASANALSWGSPLTSAPILDIVGLHVCSLLRTPDLQALGRTCRGLRQLVHHRLAPGTWSSVATNTLPAAHPALLLPGSEIRGYLEKVQRAKHVLPVPAELGALRGFAS